MVLVDREWLTGRDGWDSPAVDRPFTVAVARLGQRPVDRRDQVAAVADGRADSRSAVLLGSAAAARPRIELASADGPDRALGKPPPWVSALGKPEATRLV